MKCDWRFVLKSVLQFAIDTVKMVAVFTLFYTVIGLLPPQIQINAALNGGGIAVLIVGTSLVLMLVLVPVGLICLAILKWRKRRANVAAHS